MGALYFDRDGHPVSRQQWQHLGREPGYSRIGYADGIRYGRQVAVVTYWLGVAAGNGPDPLIFHTYASIGRPGDQHPAFQRAWGWPTLAAARAGHQAVTAWITEVAAWLTGHTSQLPAPPAGSAVGASRSGEGR